MKYEDLKRRLEASRAYRVTTLRGRANYYRRLADEMDAEADQIEGKPMRANRTWPQFPEARNPTA